MTEILFLPLNEIAERLKASKLRPVLIYDEKLQRAIEPLITTIEPLLIPLTAGEGVKCRKVKEQIEDRLLGEGFGRDTMIIGCGGGTILDLVGFVAATFCRGVGLTFIPTTLLAMVDAAIGGKNGVNACGVKNMIGTIYHPHHVYIDRAFLDTLREEELASGYVEMLKASLLARKDCVLPDIKESIQIKKSFLDPALRDLLNLGHTFGHAIEALEEFQISHGKAVAFGIEIECYIAMSMGFLSEEDFQSICRSIRQIPLRDYQLKSHSQEAWLKALALDKKNKNGAVGVVLLEAIGKPKGVVFIPEKELLKGIEYASSLQAIL